MKTTEICEVPMTERMTFGPAAAHVLVAFVGEDHELDHVAMLPSRWRAATGRG
jgi:hypothetical protein